MADSLSSDQVIARIERLRDDCRAARQSRSVIVSRASDDLTLKALDACLILLRQQQEPQQNKEKTIALRSCALDQPASPASTEPLPRSNGDYDGPSCGHAMYGPPAVCTCGRCVIDYTDPDWGDDREAIAPGDYRYYATPAEVGSGNQASLEHAATTSRSAAQKETNNPPLSPSAAVSPEPQCECGICVTHREAIAMLPSPPPGAEEQ
jgi:hypothetical protein